MKTRMTIKQQIKKAINMADKTKHTEDCIDANDDTSVFQGKCICPKPQHKSGSVRAVNAHEELLDALKEGEKRIQHLCEMVNSYSNQLGLGKKVNSEDWIDIRAIASKKIKIRSTRSAGEQRDS